MNFKVLLTTSGTGSRLKDETQDLNKVLVEIAGKPTIEYILEKYNPSIPIVVTLGYKAEQVKTYLEQNHPERIFEFVTVDKYEGEGTSLGYSMLQAEKNLQTPFVFHCCDTIVAEPIKAPTENWIAGFMVDKENTDLKLEQYRTHKIENEEVTKLNEKGDMDFESIHIGLIGIKNYENFWSTLRNIYENDPLSTGHSDVHVIMKMMEDGHHFALAPFKEWLDTGNPNALEQTRTHFAN
jgi:NDP-sugar pyrophosphorylase family protein